MKLRVAALILVKARLLCAQRAADTWRDSSPPRRRRLCRHHQRQDRTQWCPSPDAAPAISASSPPLPPDTSDEGAPISVTNRNGLRGLVAALKDVDRVELLRWDHPPPEAGNRSRPLIALGYCN